MDNCTECGRALAPDENLCSECGAPRAGFEPTVMRAPATPAPTQEILDGKWALEHEVGHGGMGTVYLATDLALDRKVAIKMLAVSLKQEPEVVSRFEREAKMLARLEHPNMVPIYAVGRKDGLPFIVMKNLEGASLSDYLRQRGRLAANEVLSITRQLCAGLGFIHAKGIIHRDIKPGNIFVGPDGHVTILDLGVAHDSNQSLTKSGLLIGTPRYMSPEQILYGSGRIDYRSDLYALAIVIFEMLTGAPVFDGESDFSVMRAHTDMVPPDAATIVPELPPEVGVVVQKALAKQPADRYQSAGELLAALEQGFAGAAAAAEAPTDPLPRPLARPKTPISKVNAGRPKTPLSQPNAGFPRTPQVSNTAFAATHMPGTPAPAPRRTPTIPPTRQPQPIPLMQATPPTQTARQPSDDSLYAAAGLQRRSKMPVVAIAAMAVIALLGVGGYLAFGRSQGPMPLPQPMAPVEKPVVVKQEPVVAEPVNAEPVKAEPVKTEPVEIARAEEPEAVPTRPLDKPGVKSQEPVQHKVARVQKSSRDSDEDEAPSRREPVTASARPTEVRITTTLSGAPSWAWLDVNGIRKGTTPAILKLEPGSYSVRLSRPGFKTVERKVEVVAGHTVRLPVELEQ